MDILKIPPQVIPYMAVVPGVMLGALNRTAGVYYYPLPITATATVIPIVANKVYAVPFLVLKSESFDRIGVYVNEAAVGNARLGIYSDSGSASPMVLVLDAGTIDTGTTGTKEININQLLSPGLYWLVYLGSATPKILASGHPTNTLGVGGNSVSAVVTGTYCSDQAYGELPAAHPTLAAHSSSSCMQIAVRRS